MTIKTILLLCFSIFIFKHVKSQQTMFDQSDSVANQLRQYIIRFDVTNGNIYVPVKKKLKEQGKDNNYFKRLPFLYQKDSVIKNGISQIIEHFGADGKAILKRDTIFTQKIIKGAGEKRYLIAGKFFKPKVGSFIRLIFENVPKGMDINVTAEFLDKNLENASTFQGFLNRYSQALDTAVNNEFRKLINDTSKKTEITNEVIKTKTSIDSTIKEIQNKTDSFRITLDGIQKDLKPLITKTKEGKALAPIIPSVNKLEDIIKALKSIQINDSSEKVNTANQLEKMLDLCKKITDNVIFNGDTVAVLKLQLRSLAKQLVEIDSSKNVFKELSSAFNLLQLQRDSIIKRYDSTFAAIYDSIYSRRTIYIQPIQVSNNDISLLKITYRKDDKQQNDIYREIMLKNRYGFKLDFSTGFVGTGLKDDNFRLVPTPNTIKDTTTIKEDPKGKFAIGFAIMAHAYFRSGERVNFALNTGLMLNGSNQTINYLAGLSLPLGLEQRLVLSGGFAFGKVKRLTSGFEIEKPYPSSILNLSSGVPYTEKWQNSWYIGVSYNISSLTAGSHKIVIAK
jgi:hypothetical protein